MSTKSLPRLALPLVISFTTRFLFTLVDMAFAAQFIDKTAVAAIAFFAPFQAMYIALWVGLSGGLTASLAAAFGHEDEARIEALKRGMRRILGFMVPTMVVLGAVNWALIPHYDLAPGLEHQFRIYCTTLLCGMGLTGFWAMLPDSVVKAHHDTRSTMVAGLIASFSNFALNALFVLVFGLGIFGIALATVLSRLGSLAYAVGRARALERARQGIPWSPRPHPWRPPVVSILTLSVPGALAFALMGLEGAVVNWVLTRHPDPVTAIASWGVFLRMFELGLMPAAGCAVAVVPFAGRLLPQGQVARVRWDLARTMVWLALASLLITVAVGWIVPRPLAAFFLQDNSGATPATVPDATLDVLRLLPIAVLAAIPFYLYRPLFEAAQRPRVGTLLSVLRFLGLSIPLLILGYYAAPALGIDGLHAAVAAVLAATAVTSLAACLAARSLLNGIEAERAEP